MIPVALMKNGSLALIIVTLLLCEVNRFGSINANPVSDAAANENNNSNKEYWNKRREEFYSNTTFNLSDSAKELIGSKYGPKSSRLPFWFDYELFKAVFDKTNATPEEDLQKHYNYVRTCFDVLIKRVAYRMLTTDELAMIDKYADEFALKPTDDNQKAAQDPINLGLSLVQDEINKIRSKNQLKQTLIVLNEEEETGHVIDGVMPWEK